jgi:HrpA-like RNA helicase
VTQPRRIAAVSVSEYIARQMGSAIPGVVGYKMRFEDRTNAQTKIKIMTDGILLQEMKLDPWLSKYSLLVVDEAHERSLTIDFILGLLKRVLENRSDFKIVVSSATINAEVFSEYFNECPVVKIEAHRFPVALVYDPPIVDVAASRHEDSRSARRGNFAGGGKIGGGRSAKSSPTRPQDSATEAILMKVEIIVARFISEKRKGDILVFLSGEKMIKDCMYRLMASPAGSALHILPLYGRMGKEEQERVFDAAPNGKTKVVLSTNIAETSITINGITAVIDSGLSKLNWYNPRSFTSSLIEAPISKASANQRKGRAGRTSEGSCYRLYTRRDFENRPLYTTEEIFRTDLSEVILRMADSGITNFEDFDFISAPEKEGLISGIETLNLLDALESDNRLSSIGKLMTEFPLAPRHSRIIVEAILRYPEVLQDVLIAVAFLSTQSPYVLPPGEETDARKAHHRFSDDHGDFVSYLKLFHAYSDASNRHQFCERSYLDERAMAEIANVAAQLEEIVAALKIPVLKGGLVTGEGANAKGIGDYLSCIGRGMIQFVCMKEGQGRNTSYRSLTADKIIIHPGSVMFHVDPQFIVAGEIVRTSRMYAMSVSPLSPETLQRIHPGLFAEGLGRRKADKHEREAKTEAEPRGRKAKSALMKPQDFTNNIKIATEVFEIKTVKGKKTAIMPWEKLLLIRNDIPAQTVYKGLKGCIIYDNLHTLLAGEKLSLILSLAPALDPENAFSRQWPRKKNFSSADDLAALLEYMDSLARPAPWKKGSKELGFLGLFTDGEGSYWLRCSRGFHTSLNESLGSLEAIIDEMGDGVDIGMKHIVNQTYRRLSDLLTL